MVCFGCYGLVISLFYIRDGISFFSIFVFSLFLFSLFGSCMYSACGVFVFA